MSQSTATMRLTSPLSIIDAAVQCNILSSLAVLYYDSSDMDDQHI